MSSSTPVGTSVQGGGEVPGKTDDTEHDLDVAVARALGMWDEKRHVITGNVYYGASPLVKDGRGCRTIHLSQDWNALMAAVAKLEKWDFCRDPRLKIWSVSDWVLEFQHDQPFRDNEALALARCIAAVGESDG